MTFEDCMRQELEYAKLEYFAVDCHDYRAADHYHNLRWRCMDAAVKLVEQDVPKGGKQ